jgi:NifU-like protein
MYFTRIHFFFHSCYSSYSVENFYEKKIGDRFHHPKNVGKCESANAVGTSASFVCGSVLRFTLQISDQKITDAKFKVSGCGYLLAAADLLAETIIDQQLGELHGSGNFKQIIENNLGDFPAERKHCAELAVETLQSAFNDFRSRRIKEFSGEKALICTCFGVSEEEIEQVIGANGCETVEEVSNICHAGSGCGSCQPLIREIIDGLENML